MIHEYNAIALVEGKVQDFSGVKRAVKDFESQFGPICANSRQKRHFGHYKIADGDR